MDRRDRRAAARRARRDRDPRPQPHSRATSAAPRRTAEAVVDGWFRTGDLGTIDDESLITIVDRKKDMIVRNGYNVYPTEVENVLMRHEAVQTAAVFGVPHEVHGQEVAAAVVLKPGAEATDGRADRLREGADRGLQVPARRRTSCREFPLGPSRQGAEARARPRVRLVTGPVPGLDVAALAAWLDRTHPELAGDGLTATVLAGGRSNLTYRLDGTRRDGAAAPLVLRRPPLGPRAGHRARHAARVPGDLGAGRHRRARAGGDRPDRRGPAGDRRGRAVLPDGPRRRARRAVARRRRRARRVRPPRRRRSR